MSVSISTISEAYRLLEDRGLITARPQSGYYVKTNITALEPNPSAPSPKVCTIDTSIIARVYADIARPQIVKLGAAIPSAAQNSQSNYESGNSQTPILKLVL